MLETRQPAFSFEASAVDEGGGQPVPADLSVGDKLSSPLNPRKRRLMLG